MSDETGFTSPDDVQREARASLDLTAVVEAASAEESGGVSPASEPGTDAGQESEKPESEPQPATSAGGDLQATGEATQRTSEPERASVAPEKAVAPVVAPEAQAQIEDVPITPEGIDKALNALMAERPDVHGRVSELDAQRKAIVADQQKLATLQSDLSEIEEEIRENETLRKHYKGLVEKHPEDLETKDFLRSIQDTLTEKYGMRTNNKIEQRELADLVDRQTRSFKEGVAQVRNFTISVMKAGVEEKRAKQQEAVLVERESKEWSRAFDEMWKVSKLPDEFKVDANRYLASYAFANVEMFNNGKTYAEFMRERIADIQRIYGHGREKAVEDYSAAKRADAKQPTPKLKPSTGGAETPESESPSIEEIQRQARASIRKGVGANA